VSVGLSCPAKPTIIPKVCQLLRDLDHPVVAEPLPATVILESHPELYSQVDASAFGALFAARLRDASGNNPKPIEVRLCSCTQWQLQFASIP
jgi:hypothetical protein